MKALAALALLAAAPGYQPQSDDERGLWAVMAEEERATKLSNFVMRDAALNAYVQRVLCRAVGPECAEVRVYILRTPYFNASMAPNGMMHIWSGLFLRTRDEAQLAAVLAHEYTHYKQRHSLRLFRNVRRKSDAMSFLAIPLSVVGGYGAATLAQVGVLASIFGFSREMEREADAGSVTLLAAAGYDPNAASQVWRQILAERDATAAQRRRRPRGDDALFGTHPASAERMADLAAQAASQRPGGERGAERYRAALAPFWADLVDDQIKLNDPGGTEHLLETLAGGAWTADLLYARGELYRSRAQAGDMTRAADAYRAALAQPDAPAEAHRGLGLALLRGGDAAGGKSALAAYLAARPDAPDQAMIAALAAR